MGSRRILYGLMGLLSLLGFIGVFTGQKAFLAFFAFAVNFEYFFIRSDEMMDEYMNRSASLAFYIGMTATALVSLVCFFAGLTDEKSALLTGFAAGFAMAVAVYAVSVAYYGFRERWGLENDKEQD